MHTYYLRHCFSNMSYGSDKDIFLNNQDSILKIYFYVIFLTEATKMNRQVCYLIKYLKTVCLLTVKELLQDN